MLNVEDQEKIRRAYYLEEKSIRQIAREQGHSRKAVRKAVSATTGPKYQIRNPRPSPVLGPYKARIGELLQENESLPRKQRYTARRIYEVIREEGYVGSQSGVQVYVSHLRGEKRKRQVYLPLSYEAGMDAQVDWGEAQVVMNGEKLKVHLFVMRLSYSRKLFVQAYPSERQECFFAGHVAALTYFGGVPKRLSYDNLKTAVYAILKGKKRVEQQQFIAFRSHYLFESHFCTPSKGHEKGGVEHGVGFARRNFMVPLPEVNSFEQLNAHLLACCQRDDQRQVKGQPMPIAEAWQIEKQQLRPLPAYHFVCCISREVCLNPYSQVVFETNRYSVPTDQAYPKLTLRAYAFDIEILHGKQVLARHARNYHKHQDILDPLHYLPLVERRPGAFEYATPIKNWRKDWPILYEQLLSDLQARYDGSAGIRHFIQILKLHNSYPAEVVQQAVEESLRYGSLHVDAIQLYIEQLSHPQPLPAPLDLSDHHPLQTIGTQPLNLSCYDQLLENNHHDH
jgi:transposase